MSWAAKAALDKRENAMRKAYEALCLSEEAAVCLSDDGEKPDPTDGILGGITAALDAIEQSGCPMLKTHMRIIRR